MLELQQDYFGLRKDKSRIKICAKSYNLINLIELVEKERVCIFIDGSNLYYNLKRINKNGFDFIVFLDKILLNKNIKFIFYYDAWLDLYTNKEAYWKQQKYFASLNKIPKLNLILCKRKRFYINGKICHKIKGDDVSLAVDLVSLAYENKYDPAIIISGDYDFVPAIKKAIALGKIVENYYFSNSGSLNLKNICTRSFCLDKL